MQLKTSEQQQQEQAGKRARTVVVLAVIITAVLYLVPYGRFVGYPLVLLSTYAHEMGHGIAAVLVGGRFDQFVMFSDASGMAQTAGNFGRFASAVVSAGGLVGPPILAAIFFVLSARRKVARAGLFIFGAAMLISCLWVVRNPFGWIFVGLVGALCVLIALKASVAVAQGTIAFLASQMALSAFSRADYLFTETAQTGAGAAPSDVAQMSKALFLPYWFWGGACAALSLVVLGVGLWLFWKATAAPEPAMSLPDL